MPVRSGAGPWHSWGGYMKQFVRIFASKKWAAGGAAVVLAGGIAMSTQILLSAGSADATETAAAGDATDSQPVIVVLRDQIPAAPANAQHMADRRSRATSAQRSVLGRLSGAKPSKVRNYTSVNGFAATVTG